MLHVFKIGGGKDINLDAFLENFADYAGTSPDLSLLVHGGNHELTRLQTRLGHPPRMVKSASGQSSRFTDRQTMEYFWMVYCGRVNKYIVERLQQLDVNAIGLSGLDGRLAVGKRRKRLRIVEAGKAKVLEGDYSGSVKTINSSLLRLLLDSGYVPVVTPPALSDNGEAINVDGDKLAAQIAIQLQAASLNFFLAAPGLLRDSQDESSLVNKIKEEKIEQVLHYADSRMKKKILATKWALAANIKTVRLGDGRSQKPITEVMTGRGTIIRK